MIYDSPKHEESLVELASNKETPQNVLLKLSRIKSSTIKITLAQNLSCPAEVLIELSKIPDINIKFYVAQTQTLQ